jgi:gliding motility-associated-like protein
MKYKVLFLFGAMLSSLCVTSQVVANFSANPTVLCPGQQVQFTDLSSGTPTTWSWSFPGGTPATSTLQHPVVIYNFPGQYQVSLSASNGGIPNTNIANNYITVNSTPPTGGVISGQFTVCQRQPSAFSITPVTGAISYSWTASASATILSGQGTNSVTLATGALLTTLCVSAGNACGYGPPACSVVVSPASPTVVVSPASSTICMGSAVSLTASGAASYVWSPTTGLSFTLGPNTTASPTISTNYTVTGTTAGGCTAAAVASVMVVPNPTVTVTPTSAIICQGGSATLIASGGATYSWSPASGLNTTSGATVVASPNANTTYSVTGIAANGCRSGTAVNVVVTSTSPPAPGPIVGPPLACVGLTGMYSISPVSNASTYSWTVPPGSSILAGQGTTTVLVSFGSASGSICVSAGNGCGYSANSCLVILPLAQPTIVVTPSSATICAGGSVSLTAAGASSYSWLPAAGLNTTSGAAVVASPSSSVVYTVRGTASSGCVGTSTAPVTVNTLPTISINPALPAICSGGSVTITASGASSYSWSPSSGLSSTSGSSVSASPASTTNYTVTGTDANGCSNFAAFTVTVSSTPPTISGSPSGPATACSGKTVNFSVAPVSGASSYSWTVPAGALVVAGQGSTLVSVQLGTTSGNICVSGVNGCGAGSAVCSSITVNQSPAVQITPQTATMCAGGFVTLSASGAITYSWSPATSISSTTMSSVVAGPPGNTTYSVTGTGANGCTGVATASVIVFPLPSVSVLAIRPSVCSGGSTTLTASGASTYTWAPSSSLSSANGSTVIASPSVTTTYSVSGTATTGCQNQAGITVRVHAAPPTSAAAPSGNSNICEGSTVTFSTGDVSSADSYSWTVSAGYTIVSGQGSTLITVQAGPANGNICVTAVNACGSSTAACTGVTVLPNPTVSAVSSGPACANSNVTLTASGAVNYAWSPATGLSATAGTTVTANSSAAGVVTVTGFSSAGCEDTETVAVIFLQAPESPLLSGPNQLCTQTAGMYAVSLEAGNSYSWTVSGGLQLISASGNIATVTATAPGTICVTAGNSCGSSAPACKQPSVIASPNLTLTSTGHISCATPVVQLSGITTATSVTYSWIGPSGATGTQSALLASLSGTYNLSVNDTISGCSAYSSVIVNSSTTAPAFNATLVAPQCVNNKSGANGIVKIASADTSLRYVLVKGTSITVPVTHANGMQLPQGGILISTLSNTSAETRYVLRAVGRNECTRDTILVLAADTCAGELFVPEIFTPDGDGTNDLFVISGRPPTGTVGLSVFNRWGNRVYHNSTYDNSWDGRSNVSGGQKLPSGTYYFILEFPGGELQPMTGFIVLQY